MPILNLETLDLLKRWLNERRSVYLKKLEGAPLPWTDWPLLQKYRFTNVKRELDRESLNYLELVATNPELTAEEKIANAFVFRFWNKAKSFEYLGFPRKEGVVSETEINVLKVSTAMTHRDHVWFTGAFHTGGIKGTWFNEGRDPSKPRETVNAVRPFFLWNYLWRDEVPSRILNAKSEKEVYKIISSVPGFGEFLAYQVFLDLCYLEELNLDEDKFVVSGPGCKQGLDFLFEDRKGLTDEELLFHLRENEHILDIDFEKFFDFMPKHNRKFTLANWENAMCELSKAYRHEKNLGRPRQRYGSLI